MIGKPNASVVDVNGKNVGTAIEAAANKQGGGWIDYMWPRPGTTKPVAKSTFATTVKAPDGKTYIVGAGGYGLK
jgi:methyl-accepting chemotaxis protein